MACVVEAYFVIIWAAIICRDAIFVALTREVAEDGISLIGAASIFACSRFPDALADKETRQNHRPSWKQRHLSEMISLNKQVYDQYHFANKCVESSRDVEAVDFSASSTASASASIL